MKKSFLVSKKKNISVQGKDDSIQIQKTACSKYTRLANSDFPRLLFWRFVLVVKKENWINKKKTNSNE